MKDLKRSSATMAAYKRKCEDEVAKEQDRDEEDYSLTWRSNSAEEERKKQYDEENVLLTDIQRLIAGDPALKLLHLRRTGSMQDNNQM